VFLTGSLAANCFRAGNHDRPGSFDAVRKIHSFKEKAETERAGL